jgi:hypothetical protein
LHSIGVVLGVVLDFVKFIFLVNYFSLSLNKDFERYKLFQTMFFFCINCAYICTRYVGRTYPDERRA